MAQSKKQQNLFDTLSEADKDFFILNLEKKVRNVNKKLKEIKQLETERKEGKELKEAQLNKIAAKAELQAKIKEQESIAKLYLEARAESRADGSAAVAAPVVETVQSISQLYFASKHAHTQQDTPAELAQIYHKVFLNSEVTRVQDAQETLVAYASGQLTAVAAQVAQVLSSETFIKSATPVTIVEEHVTLVEVPVNVAVEIQPETKDAPAEVVVVPTTEVVEVVDVVVIQPDETVTETVVVVVPEDVQEAQQTEEKPAEGAAETQKHHNGRHHNNNKRGPRKPRDENYVPREKKVREPREPRAQEGTAKENTEGAEGVEQQQQEQRPPRQPRAPRQNRPPKTEGSANADGWNVVKPAPGNHTDGYKPRTANKDRAPRDANGQNRRPFNPENRKPYNKEEKQYVRREKNTTGSTSQAPVEQQQQQESATQNN